MLRELLKIKYPIFLAPMAGVSTPRLAVEVSQAGGLGSLGLGSCSIEKAREQIQAVKEQTDLPYQVNFFCHETMAPDVELEREWVEYCCSKFQEEELVANFQNGLPCPYPSFLDDDDFMTMVIEERVPIVSFYFGVPYFHQIKRLKAAGIILMATATNLIEAAIIKKAGIDIVVAQGIEAGGHRGVFNPKIDAAIPTFDLVTLIKKELSIPVIATGGIMNAEHAKIMMKAGADGVQLGTAFVQCSTSNASEAYREALFNSTVTQITSVISGRPARGLISDWHLIDTPDRVECPPYPTAYYFAKELIKQTKQKQYYPFWAGQNTYYFAKELIKMSKQKRYYPFWAGMNVGQIRKMEAAELVASLALQMDNLQEL